MVKQKIRKFILLGNRNPSYVEKSQYLKVIDRTNVLVDNYNALQKKYDELLLLNKKLVKKKCKKEQKEQKEQKKELDDIYTDLETWDFTL